MMHLTPRFVRWCSDGELARVAWPEEPVVRLLVKFIRERIIAGTTPAAGRLVAGDPSSVCCVGHGVGLSFGDWGRGRSVRLSVTRSAGTGRRAQHMGELRQRRCDVPYTHFSSGGGGVDHRLLLHVD